MEDFGIKFLNYFYYEDNGYVTGVSYAKKENGVLSKYERISFEEKPDTLAELIIRYANETLLSDKTKNINLGNSYEIGRLITEYKEN